MKDMLDRLKEDDPADVAVDAIRMSAALVATVVRAMDGSGLPAQDAENMKQTLEIALALAWRALDGGEDLERLANRGFWAQIGQARAAPAPASPA